MKIQYASDLHMEFDENLTFLEQHKLDVVGDVLVLAGDTFYLSNKEYSRHPFWDWASKNYQQVLLVPGNHEYYGFSDIKSFGSSWKWMFRKNVGYYYNKVVHIGDTDFILSTMWSFIETNYMQIIHRGMNDFRRIRYNGHEFNPLDFNEEHKLCAKFIWDSVAKSSAKHIVVATHHVPSMQAEIEEHRSSPLAEAFIVEMGPQIAKSRIDCWIFGHSHDNVDTQIGNTRVVSNQLGYVFEHNYDSFNLGKYIEL
jgi:predicted phosphodiesterase